MWRTVTFMFVFFFVCVCVCVGCARVVLACAHVCVQDMTRAHLKMKCKEKNVTFYAY